MNSADVEVMRTEQPAYIQAAERNLGRNFLLFMLDQATFAFAITLLSETTILPAFVRTMTDTPAAFALLASTYAVAHYAPQLLGAHLATGRVRLKPLVVAIAVAERLGILAIALAAMAVGRLPDIVVLALFYVAFAGYAVTTGLIMPVYGDFMAKSVLRFRGRLFGAVQLLGGAMGFGAALVANQLLAGLPPPAGVQACFWLAFGLSFIALVFITNLREVPYPERPARVPLRAFVGAVPSLLRANPGYRWFLIGRSGIALGTMGVGFVTAAAIDRGMSLQDAAGFASVYLVAQSVSGLAWGYVGDRWGWKLVLEGGALALAGGMAAALVGQSFWAFAVAFALLGAAYAASLGSDPNITYEVAPPEDTGRYLGVTASLVAPALTLAPLVGGVLVGLGGYGALFGASIVLAVGGLLVAHQRFSEPRRAQVRRTAVITAEGGAL